MRTRALWVALAVVALLSTAVAGPLSVARADTVTPPGAEAPLYQPTASQKLTPGDVRFEVDGRQIRVVSTRDERLALITIATTADGVTVKTPGTDFRNSQIWRALGYGDLCWEVTGFDGQTSYVLPPAVPPFATVPATWRYSAAVVSTALRPFLYTDIQPGVIVTGQGQPILGAVLCMRVVPEADSARADRSDKVTLCHATSSTTNPYNLIEVAQSAAISGHGGHTGPLFPQPGWGDVIPPFPGFPGLNWPAGQGLLNAGCVITPAPTPTPTPTPTPSGITPTVPTASPTPSGITPTVPTASPTPSGITPTVPTASPTPSGITPTVAPGRPRPPIIIVPRPKPSSTPTPTPSSTPTPTATPSTTPSTTPSSSATPGESLPVATIDPSTSSVPSVSPEPTPPADVRCESSRDLDTGALRVEVTNGFSVLDVSDDLSKAICAAAKGDDTAATEETLADTGAGAGPLVIGLALIGSGLLLLPALRRRRG